MPLLSRHKSLSSSSPASSGGQQASSRRQAAGTTSVQQAAAQPYQTGAVCESPLFGTRRQLPIVSAPCEAMTADGQQAPDTQVRPGSRRVAGGAERLVGNSAAPLPKVAPRQDDTLGSIPKQISSQQVHYAFSIMDTNSDGLIDLRDLSQMLANLGIPIDESILAHVLTGASKRGDHRISENEFLEWLGHFVQVDDSKVEKSEPKLGAKSAGGKWSSSGANKWRKTPMVRSSTAASSLAAIGDEPPPVDSLRKRRGSGSGIALMRSLSSATSGAGKEPAGSGSVNPLAPSSAHSESTSGGPECAAAHEEQEARTDLRAAFCVFDLDGDGFITLDEVRAGLKLLGESWSTAELNQLFSRCGSSGSGQLASTQLTGSGAGRSSSLRANDMRQRISIEDFVRLLL